MKDELKKKAAEILVECKYADGTTNVPTSACMNYEYTLCLYHGEIGSIHEFEDINPFADTLQGRRQADCIEDWLNDKYFNLWLNAEHKLQPQGTTGHQWRLDRIKWCLQELSK